MSQTSTKSTKETGDNNVMPDFDFNRLDIKEATSKYNMPLVSPGAYLVGRSATEVNRPFRDALLSLSGRRERLRRQAMDGDFEQDEEVDRRDDLKVFPTTVITTWGGIVNKKGEEVPFSPHNCGLFLKALPEWMFDRVRVHFKIPENFVKGPEDLPPPDAPRLAKN